MDPGWYKEFFENMGIEYEDYSFTKNTDAEVAWMVKEYLTSLLKETLPEPVA